MVHAGTIAMHLETAIITDNIVEHLENKSVTYIQ